MKVSEELLKIVSRGTYYFPATSHYENKQSVTCAKCLQNSLLASVGYKSKDLCLICVNDLLKFIKATAESPTTIKGLASDSDEDDCPDNKDPGSSASENSG